SDGPQCQHSLSDGTEVSDEPCIGLRVELFGGGPGCDDTVEARDGTAGDRDEEEGEDARRASGQIGVDGGSDQLVSAAEECRGDDSAIEEDEGDEELDAVDVVAGLQQHPDGQYGSDSAVDEQDDDPQGRGFEAEERVRHRHREPVAEEDESVEGGDSDDRDGDERPPQFVDRHTDEQCYADGAPGGDDRGGQRYEQIGDDDGERGDDHEPENEDDEEEERGSASADVASRQCGNDLSPVPRRGPQGAEVMHSREEERADGDPEECRQPSPDHGDGRSHDGSGSCHGGEVVTPEDESVGGNVVDVVAQLMRRRSESTVESIDPSGQILRVEQVPECEDRDSEQEKQYGTHR